MCGEKFSNPLRMMFFSGITPACAGKRQTRVVAPVQVEDHPRVCGEKVAFGSPFTTLLGSPPRVRGKESQAETVPIELGITPACAGKSSTRCRGERQPEDHPRVCGEKLTFGTLDKQPEGSPPRVRGKADWGLTID